MYRIITIIFSLVFSLEIYFLSIDIINHFNNVPGYNLPFDLKIEDVYIHVIISILPSFFLPIKGKSVSLFLLWFVYFTHIIPSIIINPFILSDNFLWSYMIALFYIGIITLNKVDFNIKPLKDIKISYRLFKFLLLFLGLIFLFYILFYFGFNFNPPNITDVYNVRNNYIEKSDIIMGYAAIVGGYVICPVLLVFGFRVLKYDIKFALIIILISIILSFQIYSNTGFKSVAFASLACLLFYFLIQKTINIGLFLAIGIPSFLLIFMLLSELLEFKVLYYHWIRRVFISPGMNVSYFYDYLILKSYEARNVPQMVSEYYYNAIGSSNAGIIGNSLVKYKFIGLLINGVIFLFILKFADFLTKKLYNKDLSIVLFLPIGYALSNSSITTIFLSYGYIFLLLILTIVSHILNNIEYKLKGKS